jgi:hypothetical protein
MVSGGIAIVALGVASILFGLVVTSEPGETNRLPFFGWDTSTAAFVTGALLVALGTILAVAARRLPARSVSIIGPSIWAVLGAGTAFVLMFPLLCVSGSTGPSECQALIGVRYVIPGWPPSIMERILIVNGFVAALVGALIWFMPTIVGRARGRRASTLPSG